MVFAAAVALALLCAPFSSQDVSELLPVQTLSLSRAEGGGYRIGTDGGLQGLGQTLPQAVDNLRQCAPGVAVLATARQLVVERSCLSALPELIRMEILRPATQVYCAPEAVSAEDAADYLSRHCSEVTLSRIQAGLLRSEPVRLPLLLGQEGRYQLRDG